MSISAQTCTGNNEIRNSIGSDGTWDSSISILRILATVAVVFIHVATTLRDNPGIFEMSAGELSMLSAWAKAGSWAVPVFFMITGALLLNTDKKITWHDCLNKYARRIVLALIVFGIPFAGLILVVEQRTFYPQMIWQSIVNTLEGNSFGHLWYLYALIGVYLILPLLKAFVDNASKDTELYLLVVLFVFNLVIPTCNSVFGWNINFYLPAASYILFYLFAGHYLYNFRVEKSTAKTAIGGGYIAYVLHR